MSDPLPWHRAFAELGVQLTAFDIEAGVELHVDGATVAARPSTLSLAGLAGRFVVFHVYEGALYQYGRAAPPDGLCMTVPLEASPAAVADAIVVLARQIARTRCHAGAGHGRGLPRGAFGELCLPCWQAVRAFLDRDKVPLPF